MSLIDKYINNPQLALFDVVTEPSLQRFIEESDVETVTIDLGDGTQAQVKMLTSSAIRRFIERLLAEAKKQGADIKEWICSEFDLCSKLGGDIGELMRKLDDFLKKKVAQGGLAVAGLVALFTNPALGVVLAILTALGFANNTFIELCAC